MESLIIVTSIIMMEVILSVDNAVVLAGMVKHLPKGQREKALKYGIIGAYVFRGILLMLSVWIIKIIWLKLLGGVYLLYVGSSYFFRNEEESTVTKYTKGFWGTVAMVEVMDIAFSLDNVLGVVALTDNLYLIIAGVFIGILAIRFLAVKFIKLLEKYPFLETSANLVIILLGFKLVLSYFAPGAFEGHSASALTSTITIILFVIPLLINLGKKGNS